LTFNSRKTIPVVWRLDEEGPWGLRHHWVKTSQMTSGTVTIKGSRERTSHSRTSTTTMRPSSVTMSTKNPHCCWQDDRTWQGGRSLVRRHSITSSNSRPYHHAPTLLLNFVARPARCRRQRGHAALPRKASATSRSGDLARVDRLLPVRESRCWKISIFRMVPLLLPQASWLCAIDYVRRW
jgi:hypothetical protein